MQTRLAFHACAAASSLGVAPRWRALLGESTSAAFGVGGVSVAAGSTRMRKAAASPGSIKSASRPIVDASRCRPRRRRWARSRWAEASVPESRAHSRADSNTTRRLVLRSKRGRSPLLLRVESGIAPARRVNNARFVFLDPRAEAARSSSASCASRTTASRPSQASRSSDSGDQQTCRTGPARWRDLQCGLLARQSHASIGAAAKRETVGVATPRRVARVARDARAA
jgi:hypothetical protein